MLGNLHVRFGVGAGVKSPGLHHFILARGGQTYARLRYNIGPGGGLLLPIELAFGSPFPAADQHAWSTEYHQCVMDDALCDTTSSAAIVDRRGPGGAQPRDFWDQDWHDDWERFDPQGVPDA